MSGQQPAPPATPAVPCITDMNTIGVRSRVSMGPIHILCNLKGSGGPGIFRQQSITIQQYCNEERAGVNAKRQSGLTQGSCGD
eukprot:1161300-Pelagomonas_calceolata.AAC.4